MAGVNKSFPFEIYDVSPEHFRQLNEFYDDAIYNICATRFGPKGYIFPREFENICADIYNMEIRPTDIFVATFPKSGTTWTQELVWLIANNFDYETSKAIPLNVRYPFIESPFLVRPEVASTISKDEKYKKILESITPTREKLNSMASPRFIKTHLPFSLLPPKLLDTCKVVYVARDPRDVAVSFYHHTKLAKMCAEDKDFKSYWNFFINDLISWTPYFEHLKEAWQVRQHPNILFLFYEELSKDLPECARRIAKFFNKEITDEQVQKLCEHLQIDNFKNNKSINMDNMKQVGILNGKGSFIRKGKVGGWRDHFDEEMTQHAEQWIEDNLREMNLRFPQ